VLYADGSVHFIHTTPPDPNPGGPGAILSPYLPSSGNYYTQQSLDVMGYGTRAGGEVPAPLD